MAAAVVAALASWLAVNAGLAEASPPDQTGETFSDAQQTLKAIGYTAVASITVGDRSPQSNCVVVRQQTSPTSPGKVLLSLNCSPGTKQR